MGLIGFLFEFIFDSIIEGYFALMQWIIPQKWLSKNFQTVLKIIVYIFTALLFITMFFGIFALISDDEYTKAIGRYMVFIPLAISLVQIVFGIIMRVVIRNFAPKTRND